MLRESIRLLKSGAVLAAYTIHTPDGLTESQRLRATELGPPSVGASASPGDMAHEAGFISEVQLDVTDRFKESCLAFRKARLDLGAELRELEGDEAHEEEFSEGEGRLLGIEEGLLLRSLIVAVKP